MGFRLLPDGAAQDGSGLAACFKATSLEKKPSQRNRFGCQPIVHWAWSTVLCDSQALCD
jgi:hypothetical protein